MDQWKHKGFVLYHWQTITFSSLLTSWIRHHPPNMKNLPVTCLRVSFVDIEKQPWWQIQPSYTVLFYQYYRISPQAKMLHELTSHHVLCIQSLSLSQKVKQKETFLVNQFYIRSDSPKEATRLTPIMLSYSLFKFSSFKVQSVWSCKSTRDYHQSQNKNHLNLDPAEQSHAGPPVYVNVTGATHRVSWVSVPGRRAHTHVHKNTHRDQNQTGHV